MSYEPPQPVVSKQALEMWQRTARPGRLSAPLTEELKDVERERMRWYMRIARARLQVASSDWRIAHTRARVETAKVTVEGWEAGRDPTHNGRCPYKLPRLALAWDRAWAAGREDWRLGRANELRSTEPPMHTDAHR